MLTFDPKIDVGQILTVASMIAAVLVAWFNLVKTMEKTEIRNDMRHEENTKRLDKMEDELEKQTDILVQLGQTKTELQGINARLVNLERNRP
jgi:uncharacterized membrane protein YukC